MVQVFSMNDTFPVSFDIEQPGEIRETEKAAFAGIINADLTPEQQHRITHPETVYPRQQAVLATHFHPEQVSLDLIQQRIAYMFPNSRTRLTIPTQHNVLLECDGYAGVEVDCYARSFNRKVQLLVHFEHTRLTDAGVFRNMLAHTFTYRAHQLNELVETIINPDYEDRLREAVTETGASDHIVNLTRVLTHKFKRLLEQHDPDVPRDMRKNKLLRSFVDAFRDEIPGGIVNHTQALIKAAKDIMKRHFSPQYFYRVEEIIEEVRGLHGCIVVPHPEQFWPILLAQYDVDGYEVWNPQSREFTEFLIQVVNRQNATREGIRRPLLIFMGDDTHMGEKLKPPEAQDPAKAVREIGYQPAWDDVAIRKSLIVTHAGREGTIQAYRERLAG